MNQEEEEDATSVEASDQEDKDLDSDDEEVITPAPKSKRTVTKKSRSSTQSRRPSPNTTTPRANDRRSSKKSKTVTPKFRTPQDENTVAHPKDISPVTEELANSKRKRREAAVNNMKRATENSKGKRKSRDWEAENQEKDKQLEELKAKLAAAEAATVAAPSEVPRPKSRASNKKLRSRASGKSKRGVSLEGFVKQKAKDQFRHTKFVQNYDQFQERVGNKVMDELKIDKLHHKDGETALEAEKIDRYRDEFFSEWAGIMATGFNEARNYRQTRVKEACIQWLVDNKKTELFSVEDLEFIMKRDFSSVEPEFDEDGNEVSAGDPDKLEYYQKLFDWYVENLLPAVAGSHEFKEPVRHFVPVSEARFPESAENLGGKLIVTPGMEAIILVFFKNANRKWEMMHDWTYIKGHTNKRTHPYPKWSPKNPEVNKEWKTLYSDSSSGQNPFGGWSLDGMKEYNRILKAMNTVRKDKDLCLHVEKIAVARLYDANKEMHAKAGANKPHHDKPTEPAFEMEFEEEDL